MNIYLIIAGVIGVLIVTALINRQITRSKRTVKLDEIELLHYKKRMSMFNASEEALFFELARQLPQGLHIFPKLRIIDIIEPTMHVYAARAKIWVKHMDFVICNDHFEPILAIEIESKPDRNPAHMEREAFIREMLKAAGVRYEIVSPAREFKEVVGKLYARLDQK